MSFHAPHMLTDADLREMERGDVRAAEEGSGGVEQGPKEEAAEGRRPVVIWEVYEYDHQTTRYVRPYALFTEEKAARECKRVKGWVGVRQLIVWPGLSEWKAAGEPDYSYY